MTHINVISRKPEKAISDIGYWLIGKVAEDQNEYHAIVNNKEGN